MGKEASWDQFDTNRNGKLDNGDDVVTVRGNTTKIDVGAAVYSPDWRYEQLTVQGSNNLTASDFLF